MKILGTTKQVIFYDLFQWTMLDAKGELNLRIYSNFWLSTTSNVWPFDGGLCRGLWWCGSGRTSVPWGFGLELFATPSKTWYFGNSYWKLRDSIPICGIVQVLRYLLEYYGRSDFFWCIFYLKMSLAKEGTLAPGRNVSPSHCLLFGKSEPSGQCQTLGNLTIT